MKCIVVDESGARCPNPIPEAELVAGVDPRFCPDCTQGPWCAEHMAAAKLDHACARPGHAERALEAAAKPHRDQLAELEARAAAFRAWKDPPPAAPAAAPDAKA